MRPLRSLLAGGLMAAGLLAAPAMAQEATYSHKEWSFDGLFGSYDLAAAQRGFKVYKEVCSNCHAMHLLHYRDLEGIGFNDEQIKAIAASVTVPQGLDDQGAPKEGPGTPASGFRSPFPNEVAARAANNGALPPDLSLIANAREGGADYLHSLLTGYTEAPASFKMMGGMNYNKAFPGHQIAMPQPLTDGSVDYDDGTKNTLQQEARDVATFLTWAANPEMVERKQMGVRIVLFMLFMAFVTYGVKRKLWADAH
jgi:ubiquinol-cytochrome c reductase cytochrome c1 subunit